MSLITGLTKQKIDTISSVTEDGYGDKAKATVYSSVPCRWQEEEGRIYDQYLQLKDYSVEVWLPPNYTIYYNYIITKDSVDYTIIKIARKYDLAGNLDHIKVYLK
jgi:hypothetical protein